MEYAAPTAGLIIAAVLFLIGILTVNDLAARDFKITISGKVGPFQRGVLVVIAVLFFGASVAGFYWIANKPSGPSGPPSPPSQSEPARQMTLKLISAIPDDENVVHETDVITIGSARVTLSIDRDNREASDTTDFEGEPGEAAYKVEITYVLKDNSTRTVSGEGSVFVANNLTYRVDLDNSDPPNAVLIKEP
ncbi:MULTISPECIES: hypothetical protein [Streptomyces]|uniref:hypothetical protein n=1 Tax=Streptomyces TaxID=1883 RepID=UPI00345C2167